MRTTRILVVAILSVLGTATGISGSVALAAVAPALTSVTVTATDVVGGTPVDGRVTLTSAAPAGGTSVDLSSDNTTVATVVTVVTVPAGAISAPFRVTTSPVTDSQSAGSSTGTCSAFFPAGTVVRLTARTGAGSRFQGWRGLPGCSDPAKITVTRGTNITCQPGFAPT